jgi:hypothetical protein
MKSERVPFSRTKEEKSPLKAKRTVLGAFLLTLAVALGLAVPASAKPTSVTPDQQNMLASYGVSLRGVVVDSVMTTQQAIGDAVVQQGVANGSLPPEALAIHKAMKPHLRVVPVVYWGLGANNRPDNKIHVGQIVVHKAFEQETVRIFLDMFQIKFPIRSVIPQSKFGYIDADSMAANNSSNYRPEDGSEHGRAAAFDLNPVQNPFDVTAYDPSRPVEPAGAVYDPTKPGTIVMNSPVHVIWKSRNWEWGGNWGNPNADPPTDFFRVGFFDYQHMQLNLYRYDAFVAQLPPCMQDFTC